ncbi:hypothetical protein EXIGLDRAFT_68080 [Exidia glandulosa HHB12029]|uniref:C3H1-type domain-containing protein n=1 Tax=Exidia glandulosa HHB12029 TaxID=1314781 RepID=A0A165I240_EXIGL|nr:hypothetical protein EXIGLDRAFT_68080 [Exidia glandulosa HHB12029]
MPSLNMGDDASRVLQTSIQKELARLGYIENESDPVMAEYITIMLINSKTPEQITAELTDLIGAEYDSAFTTWLFDEFAKASGDSAPAAEPSSPARDAEPEEPEAPQVIQAHYDDSRSRGPPRQGALFQHAMNGLPAAGQKRSASMRSPSPSGERGPPNKARRTDLPTGPRALRDDRPRSLADRLGPAPPPQAHDQVQARINALTAQGGPPPGMMGGPGMMNPMAGPMNPIAMQEMMAAQMALMTHVAMNMGLVGPGGQFLQPGQQPPGPGFQQQQGAFPPGGSPQRGRGAAPVGRGRGRGRGGFNGGPSHEHSSAESSSPAPTPVAAPQPVAAAPAPAFTPPERPQSPTICKFGVKCTNPGCRWSHPSPVATAESGVVLSAEACEKGKDCKDKDCIKSHTSPAVANPSTAAFVPKPTQAPKPAPSASRVPCKFGAACTRAGCTFQHPAPPPSTKACRFGSACTRADCTFQHPPDRVLPGTFHRGLATNTPIVSVPTPSFHNANAASPHKSMSFKPDPKAKEFVPKATPAVDVKEEEKPVVAAAT